jgi:beta-galactosidase/beta-glucuronidase
MISDSYFYSDFWYRNEFVAPAVQTGKRAWLNFDGINWKADVWLNGAKLGRIEGGFTRARFDVTGKLKPGLRNALAVKVEKNATPGSVKEKTFENPDVNGGALGADNPTYHASIGWDWIPTIRGRNTGIWNDVRLTQSGAVTIEDPQVSTKLPLPDTSRAAVTIDAALRNHSTKAVSGVLKGRFGPLTFERPVEIAAQSEGKTSATLQLENPKLWWPAGYGEPSLYPVELRFIVAGVASDVKKFQAGVRQWAYSEEGGALRMWINGRRFVPRGGNWGFPESMLRYRGREYDAAVRYHREMNFTMIRNWVGMTGDDEFYDACDKHGIVVWQDFWLANPVDGPNPDDNELFLANVRDTLRRIRNHASIGLYCGRNEGSPPPALDAGIRKELAALHPGIHYIPDSAASVVSGHGPYRAQPLKAYFTTRATPKFHSEMGMPNIVTVDSLREFMTEADMWPQAGVWGLHDFCLGGAQGGTSFRESIDKSYGGAANAAEWVTLAQFVNYEGYRAMYEAQSKNRMGLLIWMSHPTWPSFVWQTYDYYLEPTAAYFGAKKASEPLHIQWNAATDRVEVVNYSAGMAAGLTASAEILNMDGKREWEKSASLDSAEDSVAAPIQLEFPATLTPVHFIRLKLTRGGAVVSENFYWRGTEEYNYRALRTLPKVKLEAATQATRQGGRWVLTTELSNPSAQPALMVRLKAVREKSGDRILPAIYSDNYVALMPGERRAVRVELEHADTRGERPRVVVEGFNTGEVNYR